MLFHDFDLSDVLILFLTVGLVFAGIVTVIAPWLILAVIAWFVPALWLAAHIVGALWAVVAVCFWLLVFFGG